MFTGTIEENIKNIVILSSDQDFFEYIENSIEYLKESTEKHEIPTGFVQFNNNYYDKSVALACQYGLELHDYFDIESETCPEYYREVLEIHNQIERDLADVEEFENECGYTIEQLQAMGFSRKTIENLQYNYNPETGELYDRKFRVEEAIREKEIKLETIGEKTADAYRENPYRGERAINEMRKKINEQQLGDKDNGNK